MSKPTELRAPWGPVADISSGVLALASDGKTTWYFAAMTRHRARVDDGHPVTIGAFEDEL